MSLNAIRENKVLAKISESTVFTQIVSFGMTSFHVVHPNFYLFCSHNFLVFETLSKLILHRCDKLVHETFTRHYISYFLVPSYASGFFNLHSWALSRENQTFVHETYNGAGLRGRS